MLTKAIPYDPKYLPDFIRLNRQWIEHHFKLEPMDLAQLELPEQNIIAPGGEVFFILEGGRVVATCAMVPHGPGCYELAKMAVDPDDRGKGYGDLLMTTALQWAKNKNIERVILLSNTVLSPAITLYKKHGFITTRLGPSPDYERCNIEMEYKL